jgi:hypothetical protein
VNKLFLRRPVFVKALHPRDDAAGSAGREAQATKSAIQPTEPRSRAKPRRDPNRQVRIEASQVRSTLSADLWTAWTGQGIKMIWVSKLGEPTVRTGSPAMKRHGRLGLSRQHRDVVHHMLSGRDRGRVDVSASVAVTAAREICRMA